jgi:hypothetical protein
MTSKNSRTIKVIARDPSGVDRVALSNLFLNDQVKRSAPVMAVRVPRPATTKRRKPPNMLIDNEIRKVHEWFTRYTKSGNLDSVTGYFTVGALAFLARRINKRIPVVPNLGIT